jgi:hypothetical protein
LPVCRDADAVAVFQGYRLVHAMVGKP